MHAGVSWTRGLQRRKKKRLTPGCRADNCRSQLLVLQSEVRALVIMPKYGIDSMKSHPKRELWVQRVKVGASLASTRSRKYVSRIRLQGASHYVS